MQRDQLLIGEMLDAATRIITLVGQRDAAAIEGDRQRREALLWNFTVLGEAASQLSDDFARSHPTVPWHRPIQVRNRIVHGYWSIDTVILCETAQDQLPGFVDQLKSIEVEFDTQSDEVPPAS